jgi:hypothetical protein
MKRERKPKAKKDVKIVAVVTPDGIQGSFQTEPRRPLIAHLKIRTNDVQFHDVPIQYDPHPPVQPEPYDATADNVFAKQHETYVEEKQATDDSAAATAAALFKDDPKAVAAAGEEAAAAAPKEETRSVQAFTKADLMIQFRDTKKTEKLPERTDVACFWCAHGFDWTPCIIPEREVAGVYKVYGNFCCPECAVAYLLSESVDPHTRWERIALLQRVYDQEGKGRIFPAPTRQCLKLFGGPLTIESFRNTVRDSKVRVDIHMPPMVSILGSIDTKPIDFFDTSMKNTFTQTIDKMQKAEEGLRLKRTKPLKDRESTLDVCMNIQIKNNRGVRVP